MDKISELLKARSLLNPLLTKVSKVLEEARAREAAKPAAIQPPPPPSQEYLEKLAVAREALKAAGVTPFYLPKQIIMAL